MANQFANVALDHLAKLGVDPKDLVPKKPRTAVSKQSQSDGMITARESLARVARGQDRKLQRRSARIASRMLLTLGKAFPEVNKQLIGDVVADLNSIWDTGQKLDKQLHSLFKLRFPQDRACLSNFLAFLEAIQIEMMESWLSNLRKNIPTLRKALNWQERRDLRNPKAKAH